ncbi:probable RNA 3'-terminal phosphate cyclase-like protein [Sabethes cyaneus]|uniref:probable RNA 3'-terminal phosphate cyclase-like protein n=1 Tax=Sabethes cyaneus TaxID=53552 RepID=UPI00237E481B|nr:probable RNA 3'-terminal phosphate cyclase-like protein [Sabethes cyaneus]XP_053684183.1 probable RNA 3'-terminal phosphate cyclase-like protein [Sabethes cyaneus]XP_053684191.1 probable RNA 3'-terminal phosphate cyclase-like protein [Sabethes cyaneus]
MTCTGKEGSFLIYRGSNFFKQRLILSTLSGKPITIRDIRVLDEEGPGLREYESNLLKLLDRITNGTRIRIEQDGTSVSYQPGLLHGGEIQHECCVERGIGYYLDVLVALGPFCKLPLDVTLTGVTNSVESPSVDHIKASAFATLKRFLIDDEGLSLVVRKRGLMPAGGGEVGFTCPVKKTLKAIQCTKQTMVKRIRGMAYCCKVSPAMANRAVESAKGVMLNFLPDVYINTDQHKGKRSGNSPGFGVNLVAETTDGTKFSAEVVSKTMQAGGNPTVPEDLGRDAAMRLLDEVYRGGCVDSTFQWMAALFMALGQKDVSKFLVGPLSQYTIYFLQHLREFFGITFKLENASGENENDDDDDDEMAGSNKVMLTCVGIGYSNYSKKVT